MRSLANRRAGKNMEVGQIVSEPGPPSRYCDVIIHHKLSTHGDNLRRTADQPTGCLSPHAASSYASSSSLPFPPCDLPPSHLRTRACILRNDAFTYERTRARCHRRARTNARNRTVVRERGAEKNRFDYVDITVYDSKVAMDFMPELPCCTNGEFQLPQRRSYVNTAHTCCGTEKYARTLTSLVAAISIAVT